MGANIMNSDEVSKLNFQRKIKQYMLASRKTENTEVKKAQMQG